MFLPCRPCCGGAFDCEAYFAPCRPAGKTGLPDVIYIGVEFLSTLGFGYDYARVSWEILRSGVNVKPAAGSIDVDMPSQALTHLGGGLYEWVSGTTIFHPCGNCPPRKLTFDCSTGLVTASFPFYFGWEGPATFGDCLASSQDYYNTASQTVAVQSPVPPTCNHDFYASPLEFGDPLMVAMHYPTIGNVNFLDALALGYSGGLVTLFNCKEYTPVNTVTPYQIALSGTIFGASTSIISGSEAFETGSGDPVLNDALWWRVFNPWWS